MKHYINLKIGTLFLILLSLGIMIYSAVVIIKYPLIGLSIQEENNQWVVEKIYKNGWAANYPIEKGDVVALIDGKRVEDHSTVTLFNRIEKAESITIFGENEAIEHYAITYENMDNANILSLLIPLTFGVIMMLLSVFLYLNVRKDRTVIILICFLLSIGVCYLSAFVSARGDIAGWFFTSLTLTSSIIFLIHFLRVYFLKYNMTFIQATSLASLYIINFFILLAVFLNRIIFELFDTAKFELAFFVTLISILIIYLFRFYMKEKYSRGRAVIKILGVTVFLAFGPFIFFYVIPNVFGVEELMSTEIASTFLIIIPIALVYLLLAERLFDIDFMFNRLRYYSLLAIPTSILIVLSTSFIPDVQLDSKEYVIVFMMIYVGVTILLYIKEYLDYKFRHHLFSQKGNLELSLYNFFQKTKHEMKISNFINYLKNEIKEVLGVKNVCYYEIYSKETEDSWFIQGEESYSLGHVQEIKNISWTHFGIGTLIALKDGFGLVIGGNNYQKKVVAFGMKDSKVNLNIQERIWLETLAYFSSILLENFLRIEELVDEIEHYKDGDHYPPWLSRLLFALAERERANLSIDLHDSVLQDQLQLLREIEQIELKTTSSELKKDLSNLKEKMLDNIHLVRETCNELQPPFLSEVGVIQSIQNLINQTNLRCSFILTYELDKSIQWLDKDVELTLYRVVQELFNNAMEHSEATNVSLEIKQQTGMITLTYNDNGIGFNAETLQDSFKTMGLFGIRERVKSIGGSIKIITAEGEGVSVYIEIKEVEY